MGYDALELTLYVRVLVCSNNKFYMGQLIVDRGGFVVFRKWGRVGAKTPQSQTQRFGSVEEAEWAFQKVFQAKSGNKWPLTQPFVRKKGKYFLVGASSAVRGHVM